MGHALLAAILALALAACAYVAWHRARAWLAARRVRRIRALYRAVHDTTRNR